LFEKKLKDAMDNVCGDWSKKITKLCDKEQSAKTLGLHTILGFQNTF
jgi:hypothetical protein